MSQGELLVALLKERADFVILRDEGWYRIPVDKAPRRWPPKWLAFYQPGAFKEDAFRIRYHGEVESIKIVKRSELFPNETYSSRSEREYYRIQLKSLQEREQPIICTFPRRLIFISTTWEKFLKAEEINDIFDNSPLEDRLWKRLKELKIRAERQWLTEVNQRYYQLDFAMFCIEGKVDIETDGDSWHSNPDRTPKDNQRQNDLESAGWHTLRFNGLQIKEQLESYCITKIEVMINKLGGLNSEGLVPRIFYPKEGKNVQQLSMFDANGDYFIEEAFQSREEIE